MLTTSLTDGFKLSTVYNLEYFDIYSKLRLVLNFDGVIAYVCPLITVRARERISGVVSRTSQGTQPPGSLDVCNGS